MAKKHSLVWSWCRACAVGSPNNNDGDGNITEKVKSLCFKLYRDYLISFNSQDVGKFFLELNSKRLYRSSGKEKETLLHFANSLINPIAYTCRLSIFRKTLNGLVQKRQVRVEITKRWNKMSLCKSGHPFFSRLASNAFPDIGSVGRIEKKKQKQYKITSSLGI